MLDRLPTELLHLVPLHFDPLYYTSRNPPLRACCLVSKAVHDVAHPMLWRAIRWKEGQRAPTALEAETGLWHGVRELLFRTKCVWTSYASINGSAVCMYRETTPLNESKQVWSLASNDIALLRAVPGELQPPLPLLELSTDRSPTTALQTLHLEFVEVGEGFFQPFSLSPLATSAQWLSNSFSPPTSPQP
jgi:hypothetical protein